MPAAVLSVDAVTKRFGGIRAVDGVSLMLAPSSVLGLIGPNGSGKTTLLNLINGVHVPDSGRIALNGLDLIGRPPHELAEHGIARTFQNARVFKTLTTHQNMLVPMLHRRGAREAAARRAFELLGFVGLESRASQAASELSVGQQKLLEFARALMGEPRVVLMDEPFAGVHPEIKGLLIERIRDIALRTQAAFLIVSHEVPDLVRLSGSMLCLAQGRCIAAGDPAAVVQDARVIDAYLGHAAAP